MADTMNAYDNTEGRTPVIVLDNHPNDSRVTIREDGIVQTLSSLMGTGGGNTPLVILLDATKQTEHTETSNHLQ